METTNATNYIDDDWVYPKNHVYQRSISELMSFVDGRTENPYSRNEQFTKDQLLALRPSHIRRFMLYKAFKTDNPGDDDMPVHHRAESLRKVKQAISFFMVNKGVAWIEGVGGNW